MKLVIWLFLFYAYIGILFAFPGSPNTNDFGMFSSYNKFDRDIRRQLKNIEKMNGLDTASEYYDGSDRLKDSLDNAMYSNGSQRKIGASRQKRRSLSSPRSPKYRREGGQTGSPTCLTCVIPTSPSPKG